MLPQELETIIYKYEHELKMTNVMDEMKTCLKCCGVCAYDKMNISYNHCYNCHAFICSDCTPVDICWCCENYTSSTTPWWGNCTLFDDKRCQLLKTKVTLPKEDLGETFEITEEDRQHSYNCSVSVNYF